MLGGQCEVEVRAAAGDESMRSRAEVGCCFRFPAAVTCRRLLRNYQLVSYLSSSRQQPGQNGCRRKTQAR
jgi:hypothetical protein